MKNILVTLLLGVMSSTSVFRGMSQAGEDGRIRNLNDIIVSVEENRDEKMDSGQTPYTLFDLLPAYPEQEKSRMEMDAEKDRIAAERAENPTVLDKARSNEEQTLEHFAEDVIPSDSAACLDYEEIRRTMNEMESLTRECMEYSQSYGKQISELMMRYMETMEKSTPHTIIEHNPDVSIQALPDYNYTTPDDYLPEIYHCMLETYGNDYDADVILPAFDVYRVNENDPENVMVYGCFALTGYDKQFNTLITKKASLYQGIAHIDTTTDPYTVEFEEAEMGPSYNSWLNRNCPGMWLQKRFKDEKSRREAYMEKRVEILNDYIFKSRIHVAKVFDVDGTEIDLKQE